ncbi:MAG: response regulator [Spirochaetia bacterium]
MITFQIVDSYVLFAEGLKQILESELGYHVSSIISTGQEGYIRYIEDKPSVVIIDQHVQGVNGILTAKRILEYDQSAAIMLMANFTNYDKVKHAMELGIKSFITKSTDTKELLRAVYEVLNGRKYIGKDISLQGNIFPEYTRKNEDMYSFLKTRLSPRELMVLQLVSQGYKTNEVFEILGVSKKTVETYKCRAMKKLGLQRVHDLIFFAIKHDLIDHRLYRK